MVGRKVGIELTANFCCARGKFSAPRLAIILPIRRWTCRSAEYSGSPIAGDFNHARKSSRNASVSIVMVFFRYDNNGEGVWFKCASIATINRRNLIRRSVLVIAVTGCVLSRRSEAPASKPPSPLLGLFLLHASIGNFSCHLNEAGCRPLALSGHATHADECPLLGEKWTSRAAFGLSHFKQQPLDICHCFGYIPFANLAL